MSTLLALLVTSLGLGLLAQRSKRFPPQTNEALNAFILNVSLPALVLRAMHQVPLTTSLLGGAAMMWMQILGAWGLFVVLGKLFKWPRGTVGALVLTGGLGNTAFVGLPLIEAVIGKSALGVGVFVDQIGSFLALSTVGMVVAGWASGQASSPVAIVKRVALFPPFIALVVALLLRPFTYPAFVETTLVRLGDMLTPLALFSIGFQLRFVGMRERLNAIGSGLLYKLALSPLMAGLTLALLMPTDSVVWKVAVLQCAMGPMVTGGILAAQNDLDPPLAAAMVGLGTPVSALTLIGVIAAIS